jgi:hypothetical protein
MGRQGRRRHRRQTGHRSAGGTTAHDRMPPDRWPRRWSRSSDADGQLGLGWADLDLDNGTVMIGQTVQRAGGKLVLSGAKTEGSESLLPLPEWTWLVLMEHHESQTLERERPAAVWQDHDLVFSVRGRNADGASQSQPPFRQPAVGSRPSGRTAARLPPYPWSRCSWSWARNRTSSTPSPGTPTSRSPSRSTHARISTRCARLSASSTGGCREGHCCQQPSIGSCSLFRCWPGWWARQVSNLRPLACKVCEPSSTDSRRGTRPAQSRHAAYGADDPVRRRMRPRLRPPPSCHVGAEPTSHASTSRACG